MIFLGIDPGTSSGCIAVLRCKLQVGTSGKRDRYVLDQIWPLRGRTTKEISDFFKELVADDKVFAALELVGPMPKQGISSTSKFMKQAGILEGVLESLYPNMKYVLTKDWQACMNCLTGGDKKISVAKASKFHPTYPITQQNADSIILAHYAKKVYELTHPQKAKPSR